MKYRILVRVHTARRDAAPLALYQRILERMGWSVMLARGSSFPSWLELWKPHAVVVGTFGQAEQVKKITPRTKAIVFDQEGFKNPGMTHAEQLVKAYSTLDNIDLVLVWGKKIIEEFENFAPQLKKSHIHVVGNPKLDLVRFLPDRLKSHPNRTSVGVVCRFHNLNHYEGRSMICKLPSPGNLERVFVQLKTFGAMIDVIRAILERTDYNVSLRPHPSEQVESYQKSLSSWCTKKYLARISVDDGIDFSAWAASQKALLSPSSTSFLEAYLLGIPVINLDKIADTVEHNREHAPVVGEWQRGGLMPKDVDEVCRLLNEGLSEPPRNDEIERQLTEYCDWQSAQSACLRAATITTQLLKESEFQSTFYWPTKLVDLRDAISFNRAMSRNPLYHNFSYRQGHHETPSHYDEMVDKIFAESAKNNAHLKA